MGRAVTSAGLPGIQPSCWPRRHTVTSLARTASAMRAWPAARIGSSRSAQSATVRSEHRHGPRASRITLSCARRCFALFAFSGTGMRSSSIDTVFDVAVSLATRLGRAPA